MAKHEPIPLIGNPLASDRYARNGLVANPTGYRLAGHRLNTIAALRRRMLMSFGYAYNSSNGGEPAEAAGSSNHLHTIFRTLPDHTSIAAHFALAPTTSSLATAPRARLVCTPVAGGAATNGGWVTHNAILDTGAGFPGYGPDDLSWGVSRVELAADTAYYATMELDNYCTLFSAMIYEEQLGSVDDTDETGCNPMPLAEYGDILDGNVSDIVTAATALWRKSGAYLMGFTQREEDAVTVASATPTNVLDGTSTAITDATPGFVLDTQHHCTRMRSAFPVEVGIVATRVSGTGALTVQIQDASGSLVKVVTATSGASVTAATIEANAGATKYDLWASCEAGESWHLHCVGLWEYDS